ncbi:MAG: hypothetical protein R6V62_10660 [Candidatus Fermentibacteraceae bacterium]
MQPVKAGDKLVCSDCGVELEVTKGCGCDDCAVICCGKPMEVVAKKAGGCCCCSG